MPGFEVIDKKERNAVDEVFKEGGILMAHGFDNCIFPIAPCNSVIL